MKLIKSIVSYVLLLSLVCTSLVCIPATAASGRFDYSDIPLAPESAFSVEDYTQNGQSGVLLIYYTGTASKVRIPDKIGGKPVLAICSSCFGSNDSVTHIILPDTLKYAEEESFVDCSKLEVLHLGSLQGALDYHGLSWLLKGCNNLRTLSMSDEANFPISYDGFGAIESISGAIFYRETLDSIREIYLGKSMSNVCVQMFYGNNLEWVEVGSENPKYSSHKGVVYSADGKRLIVCGTAYKSDDYEIPDGVTAIEGSAFQDCTNLKSITIPESVVEIIDPFEGCEGLTIYGATGSAAYEYAAKKNIPFIDKSYVDETGVTVSPSVLAIDHGQSKQLSAAVTPPNATRKEVTWSSSNENVVTVDSSGLVTGKSVGTATVTAKTYNGKTATCKVTVKTVPPTGISLNKADISIPFGGIETLKATVTPSNATDNSIKWSSSNTDVATVSNGSVKAKAIGTAIITAETSNGKTATCRINVKKADGISINATKVDIYALDKWEEEFISIPETYNTSFQLSVTGANDVRYVCDSSPGIRVSEDGLITPLVRTYYWYGYIGTTFKDPDRTPDMITEELDFGETTVKVYADDKVFEVVVDLIDYGCYYAEQVMDSYVEDNIKSSMSTYEKADTIAKFAADRDYSVDYSSYTGLVLSGGGDCWASTSAIVYMAQKAGLNAWVRNGNKDPGAGSGHVNAIISDGTLYYEADAGYYSHAPRYYFVKKRDCLYSYSVIDSNKAEIYQYDVWDFPAYFNIPSEVEGKKVVSIGDSFMPRRSSKTGEYTIKTVTIPDTVTKIGNDAFTACYALENLSLPDSLTEIGDRAFNHCSNLKSVYIPESVTVIGENAFGYSMSEKISDFTIYGHKGSAAEKYAKENGFTFIEKDNQGVIVSGKITSYLSDSQPVIISLIQDGKIKHSARTTGDFSDYSIPFVDAGKYTMRISKTGHITRAYTLTVNDSNITKDAVICPKGDVTGDGKTNVQDCTAILRYVRKLGTDLSDYQFKCGDVTGDGKVNVQDVTRILRHVRKIEELY